MTAKDDVKTLVTGLERLDFHHPYTPYDVQETFMKTVYNVLQEGNGQVGILESPTGTVSKLDLFSFIGGNMIEKMCSLCQIFQKNYSR